MERIYHQYCFLYFLKDLEHYLLTNNNVCLDIRELNIYLKLVVILYTDDTVLFANNEDDC